MTLTEFLFARIAEQAEWAEHPLFPEVVRARLLATCRAHRSIIELAYLADEEGAEPVYLNALRALGAIYADHPDYDEAWRR